MSSSEQVDMQMRNRLASMRSVIYDNSESIGQIFGFGDLGGCQKKMAEQSLILG